MTSQFHCVVQGKSRTLPFKLEPGDSIALDFRTHRFAAHYANPYRPGRVIYFADYKRASNDVMQHGGKYGFVDDLAAPDPAVLLAEAIAAANHRERMEEFGYVSVAKRRHQTEQLIRETRPAARKTLVRRKSRLS